MTAISLRLTETEQQHLSVGAAALGIELDASMVRNLGRFADVLDLWRPRVNLISCGSARELVERHFLDSLAIAPILPDSGAIVDLGTGAGFPGLPLAILRPRQKLVLVEARRRRVNFLREVKRTLQLSNVEILEQRAENPAIEYEHQAESVVSRAVWSDAAIVGLAAAWLRPEGRLFWMRSELLLGAEIAAHVMVRQRTLRYRIGSDRLRIVEVYAFPPEI